jgi:acyl-CoA reductase-like NAD-dependent aldehyde dehydrogenase
MQMYIAGAWTGSANVMPVVAPFSGEVVDTVPMATSAQVDQCVAAAKNGARAMAKLTGYERNQLLQKAADLLASRVEEFARTISLEEGKPLAEARGEVSRMPDLLRLCGFEGTQIRGESLPLDSQVGTKGKLGLTLRTPCGVVLAITPFNYPVLLVVHKIGPALAAGNAVILKPAERTPLSALKLTKVLLEVGFPENAIQCILGNGSDIGPQLCAAEGIRKISFTGSSEVGAAISRVAGVKRLSLELGSNSPLVILSDADLEKVAEATATGGYVNAGQVCISTQRVLVHKSVYADFLDALKPKVEAITVGDPLKDESKLSAMINEKEAQRVESWVSEAVSQGARIVTGGERSGAVYAPTVVADVKPQMRISCEELFGPAVAVTPVGNLDEALELSNDSKYGLGAGIFTRDVTQALKFARGVESGNVMINWTPLWRADFMPYGGFKSSGIGKEGPRYSVEEMTETKTVVFHGLE